MAHNRRVSEVKNTVTGRKTNMLQAKVVLQQLGMYVFYIWMLSLLWILGYRYVSPPATNLMYERKSEVFNEEQTWKPVKYTAVEVEEVSKEMPLAVIASEDQNYLQHYGFDFKAMKLAFHHNRRGRTVRGGSTISQQVAKNVFLWNERSYTRKALEVYFTALIELLWGKERILEMYLSVAETGNLVFGVDQAARWAFHKSPENLSRKEAATIAAVLPNPRKFSARRPSGYILVKRNRVAKHMRRIGGLALVEHFY